MGGLTTTDGTDPLAKFRLLLGLARPTSLGRAGTELLSGSAVDLADTAQVRLAAARPDGLIGGDTATWELVLSTAFSEGRLRIVVSAMTREQALQMGEDERDPNPAPDAWQVAHGRWELFNCVVLDVKY